MKRQVLIAALAISASAQVSAQEKQPPYWASIASGEAMMRTGPGRNYPGVWLYQRRDLPVRVVQLYPNWRKIVDPDGAQGWMLVSLLSARRSAIVKPGSPRELRTRPDSNAPVHFRAEPGVVGRLDHCDGNWCHMQVGNRAGYVAQAELYGVAAGETFKD